MKVTIDKKKKTVTIELPLQEPTPSKSGKTLLLATTSGNKPTTAEYDGETVTVGVNCWIKNRNS